MSRFAKKSMRLELDRQSALRLLAVTFDFLRKNDIAKQTIVEFTRGYGSRRQTTEMSRQYANLQSTHEEMGVIMATWFSEPQFLDESGSPLSLSRGTGSKSIASLIRVSRASIEASTAVELMSESPSFKFESDGKITALRRVFVLPEFVVPRAAFVIERFLETLHNNAQSRKLNGSLLLERSCHVSEVDLSVIAPLLRDIEARGTAFMDSIDGEIEEQRLRRQRKKPIGEMGVLVFAWTKGNNKPRHSKVANKRTSLRKNPSGNSKNS